MARTYVDPDRKNTDIVGNEEERNNLRRVMSANEICSSPGSAKARPERPRSVAITIAVPNGEGWKP